MTTETLTVTDNRTGKSYELPIENGTIRTLDLRQIKVADDDFGLMGYDPAFQNTASCKSRITYIDGEHGILNYRGYSIQSLVDKSSFLEVAYLLLYGELPTRKERAKWVGDVKDEYLVHENIRKFMDGFRYDAHPMSQLVSTLGALSSFYPSAKNIDAFEDRRHHIVRMIAEMPTLAAWSYRHSMGYPMIYPDAELSYAGNFIQMMKRTNERNFTPEPALEEALDALFILHADHEQNCSTSTMRVVGSSLADPYSAVAASVAALYGPLHGGANEAVLRMLREIGDVKNIPSVIKQVKAGERRLMGFGHRVYRAYDPRARAIKGLADRVFEVTGTNPLLDVALELERIALEDEYFAKRRLYPNVDFYSGLIYEAMGIPTSMFTVLFAIPRVAGWLAQWNEMIEDREQKIARPRQIYLGHELREYIPLRQRD